MKFQNATAFLCISIFLTELSAQKKIIILLSHVRRLPYRAAYMGNFVEQRFHFTLCKTNGDLIWQFILLLKAIYFFFKKYHVLKHKNFERRKWALIRLIVALRIRILS